MVYTNIDQEYEERERFYNGLKLPPGFEAKRFNGMNRVHLKYHSAGFAVFDMKKKDYNLASRVETFQAIGVKDYSLTENLGPNCALIKNIKYSDTEILYKLIDYISRQSDLNERNIIENKPDFKEWIIPCNLKYYKLEDALKVLKTIDWQQSRMIKKASVGDFVYIYCTGTKEKNRIRYKGVILEVNKTEDFIYDADFSANHQVSSGPCFTIAVFRDFNHIEGLTYDELRQAGLTTKLQGPIVAKGKLAKHLHYCDLVQKNSDETIGRIPETCLGNFPFEIREYLDDAYSSKPLDDTHSVKEQEMHAASLSMKDLERIAKQKSTKKPKEVTRTTIVIERDAYVSQYAKRRAKGICQLCGDKAPFVKRNGEPYLETHHIVWLSKGGEDSINNVVALCPNCHKKMHYLNSSDDILKLKQSCSDLVL